MTVFTIDGKVFDKIVVTKLQRSFSVLDTPNTGRTLADGRMHRDIIGTYYNYQMDVKVMDKTQYDEFYEMVSAPVPSHRMSFPYGQTIRTFDAYVTDGTDELQRMSNEGNKWIALSLKFIAMEAARTP